MRKALPELLELVERKTRDYYYIDRHRRKRSAFTRERKLSFQKVMFMRLDTIKESDTIAAYNTMRNVFEETPVTRQAFEEARNNISHTAFEELLQDTAQGLLDVTRPRLYKGRYRPMGIDGSLVMLPKSEMLKAAFGKSTPAKGEIFCRISVCAELLNDFIVDGDIAGFDTGEREMAQAHIRNVTCPEALFIFDRGYWSPELLQSIEDGGRKFLVRLASNGISAVTKAEKASGSFEHKGMRLRFHTFRLSSGEMEYLVTNLSEEEATDAELKELYALRWGVETRYNELKNKLEFIRFSGKSELIVKQDFFAYLTVMNLIAAAVHDANEIAQQKKKEAIQQYDYKPNKTVAINILKTRYLRATLESDPQKKSQMFSVLLEDIARFTVPVRPDRHFPRQMRRDRQRR